MAVWSDHCDAAGVASDAGTCEGNITLYIGVVRSSGDAATWEFWYRRGRASELGSESEFSAGAGGNSRRSHRHRRCYRCESRCRTGQCGENSLGSPHESGQLGNCRHVANKVKPLRRQSWGASLTEPRSCFQPRCREHPKVTCVSRLRLWRPRHLSGLGRRGDLDATPLSGLLAGRSAQLGDGQPLDRLRDCCLSSLSGADTSRVLRVSLSRKLLVVRAMGLEVSNSLVSLPGWGVR